MRKRTKVRRGVAGIIKKVLCITLACVMVFANTSYPCMAKKAGSRAKLANKRITIRVGKQEKIKIANKVKKAKYTFKSSNKKIASVSR